MRRNAGFRSVSQPRSKKRHLNEEDNVISDDPKLSWENVLLIFMANSRNNFSISEYMQLRAVSRKIREFADNCIQGLTKKIKISNRAESFHQDVSIFTHAGREVFKASLSVFTVCYAIGFLDKIGAHPTSLDVAGFNHGPNDGVLDALTSFDSFKQIWLNEECKCYEDCLKITRFNQMTDIFSISPASFMENKHGVNSLTIDASLPKRCVDYLEERSGYNIIVSRIFPEFTNSIKFLARVLYIKRANRTHIDKKYFTAMVKLLRVEELIFFPETDEQTFQSREGPVRRRLLSPYLDLKFAQLPRRDAIEYWDDSDEKIKLKVLSYTAVDRIPCTAIVERMCSWFETSKETLLIFPNPRTYKELVDDVSSLCSYLIKFDYPMISLRFTVYKPTTAFPNLQYVFKEIRTLLQEKGFLYSGSKRDDNSFDIEVEKNFFVKKLHVTQIDPPPPAPPSPVGLRIQNFDEGLIAVVDFDDEIGPDFI